MYTWYPLQQLNSNTRNYINMLHLIYMNSTSLQENFIHLFKKKKNYILIGNITHGKLLRKKQDMVHL